MTYLAEVECQRNGWKFADTFRNQYLITAKSETGPEGWKTLAVGGWNVSHCPDLPVCKLTLSDGSLAGVVLGYAISADGMMLGRTQKMPVKARAKDRVAQAEAYIATLAGRYVVLVGMADTARIYPDPVCGLGPVFQPATRRAGASTALVLDRDLHDNPDAPVEAVRTDAARYLFGLTADAEARRAIPNHYLDLADFSQHRHWPTDDTAFDLGARKHQDLSAEIVAKLGANITALCARHSTALPITGSAESRLLLAAGHDSLDMVGQFFTRSTNRANAVDAAIALEIAETMSLPLRVISRASPRFAEAMPQRALRQYLKKTNLRAGMEPLPTDRGGIRALAQIPEDALILQSGVADLARAGHWHRDVFYDADNTRFAMESLGLSPDRTQGYDRYEQAFLDWKSGLPKSALPRVYDLLHTELRLPHTDSAAAIAELRHVFVNPFNDRRLIHLAACIPPMIRKRRRVVNDIVYGGARDIWKIHYSSDRIRARKQEAA